MWLVRLSTHPLPEQSPLEKMQKSASFQKAMLNKKPAELPADPGNLDDVGKEELQGYEEPRRTRIKVTHAPYVHAKIQVRKLRGAKCKKNPLVQQVKCSCSAANIGTVIKALLKTVETSIFPQHPQPSLTIGGAATPYSEMCCTDLRSMRECACRGMPRPSCATTWWTKASTCLLWATQQPTGSRRLSLVAACPLT